MRFYVRKQGVPAGLYFEVSHMSMCVSQMPALLKLKGLYCTCVSLADENKKGKNRNILTGIK